MSQAPPYFFKMRLPFLLLLGVLGLAGCQSSEKQAQSHYERGVALVAQGDLVKASVELRQALQLKGDLVPAKYVLGTVLERQSQFETAAAAFREVAEQDPKHVDARVHLGRILVAANQLDAAQKSADEAYALNANNTEVLALKAAVAFKLGNRFDAIKFGEAALSVAPDNIDALMVLAAERLAASDPKGALQFIDKANGSAALNDRNVAIQLFRITALQALGDDAGIEATFKKLVSYYPRRHEYARRPCPLVPIEG